MLDLNPSILLITLLTSELNISMKHFTGTRPTRMAARQREHTKRWRGCGATGTLTPHCWECRWGSHCRRQFVGTYKTKLALTLGSSCAPWYLPNELKTGPHKNLHMGVYRGFVHNCQILEAIKMSSVGGWIDCAIPRKWNIIQC